MCVIGAALGAAYTYLVPAQVSSTTLLLFPSASGSVTDGQEPITTTQVEIAASTPVFGLAGKSVTPKLSADEAGKRVRVVAKTGNLIEITAFSTVARQAESLSEAVANSYITTLRNNTGTLSAVPVDLASREAHLRRQLANVRSQIGATAARVRSEPATSARGVRDAQLLGELTNDQTGLLVRLDIVRQAEDQSAAGGVQIPDIIQPAAPATGPDPAQRLAIWIGIGALAAAAFTAIALMIRRRLDPRVRTRDDLADAVASSSLAVVRGRPQRSAAGWLALFETYEAPAEQAWAFRQLLRALGGAARPVDAARTAPRQARVEHPRSVTVVSLVGDQRAAAIGPQLAVSAASLGINTRLVVATKHDSVVTLVAACSSGRDRQLRPGLTLGGEVPADDDDVEPPVAASSAATPLSRKAAAPAELTVVVVVTDRRKPAPDAVASTEATVLAISPGFATRQELARLAVAVDDAGRRIDGVVVSDLDPADRTTGRRTLDQRAVQPALPIRVTGPAPVAASSRGSRTR